MPEHVAPALPPIARPLTTPAAGLTDAEAARRRSAGQGNEVRQRASRTYWDILRQNAYPAINGVLLSVSVLLVLWGLYVEALLTAGPVIGIISVGVIQEGRAKRSLDRIAVLTRPRATVVRDGEERQVDPADLVVGDLVVARRGDQVVVDGTIVGGTIVGGGRAELDESLLTGESDPIPKVAGDEVWSGSAVVSGTVVYEATAVGTASLAGHLLTEAKDARHDQRTPLQHEIAVMIWTVAAMVALTAIPVALSLRAVPGGADAADTLGAAAVLVSLVPQGLAIMVTFTYAAGALRVSRLGALVQRQNAIESISRVTTLCVDKTGTLTTQRITFDGAVWIALDRERGVGRPTGSHEPNNPAFGEGGAFGGVGWSAGELGAVLGTIAASSAAPNRTTAALAAAHPAPPVPLADEVPFASERRWSAVCFDDGSRAVVVLGAPGVVLDGARLGPAERVAIEAQVAEATARGARVLLLGRGPDGAPLRDADDRPVLPTPVVPLAMLSFSEELRADARATLEEFRAAGVDLKVISGDDPATVRAIGRHVGLVLDGPAPAGPDLAALTDEALDAAADAAPVFGRVDPPLKARLVDALRRKGRYVAMVGDGVNDILSLRRANLGIAMESGSSATRGVADIVLMGDQFAVLPRAVVEGRRIVAAMEATLILLLTRTFAMLVLFAGAAMAGLPVPLTPRQNSILAFASVGLPLLIIAVRIPPRRPPRSLLRETLRISIPVGIGIAALALPAFAWALDRGVPSEEARTLVTTLMVFCGLGILPLVLAGARRDGGVRATGRWPWILAGAMALAYTVVLYLRPLRDFFGLSALAPGAVAALVGVAAAWTVAAYAIRSTGLGALALDRLTAAATRHRSGG